ncbi:hypothetical protein EV182_002551 [Spiromyces aspiralis]|uniref:Uncharacterized protein n=1 Tax=Spiromyces aspiralis TaxID=68401 RepID=A0ACC1HSB5_9FUNG|nr:hypothetical protein EV182_002551 [Spiromyces aspiralis]
MSLSNPKPGETKGGYTAPQQQQQQQQQQPPPYTAHPASSPPPSSQPQVFATGYGPSYAKPPPPQRIASQGPYSSGLGPDISPPAYSYSVPPIPSPLIGPTLQFQGVDIATAAWLGSILILTRSSATQPAEVISTTAGLGVGQQRQQQPGYGYSYSNTIWDDGIHGPGEGKPKEFFGKPIYYNPYSGYTFWRADISIPLHLEAEKWIQYQILWDESPHGYAMDFANGMAIGGSRRTYDFRVPSQKGPWRFCAFGNTEVTNKLNTPVYGSNQPHCRSPLWDDLEAKHRKLPFHLMLGTGGQINGEAVWDECQAVLRPFFRHQNPTDIASAANKFSWTEDMERAVDQFYFNRYLQVWFPPVSVPHENSLGMCDLLAHIPYSFVIDDADIFSCFGSHQDSVQRSVVVSNIGRIAVKYWCLFQAHTTQNLAIQHNFIGKGYNWLKQLGPFTAVLGLDSRTERSQREIISNASYTSILNAVEQRLCEYTKHLIVVVPNPVIFPHTQLVESVVSGADSIGMLSIANTLMDKFAGGPSDPKRKLAIRAENRFGRRDFLVKLNDQWTSSAHLNERNRFVQRLQDLSRRRSLRITFVSGHVNFGGCGCLQSYSGQGLDANSIDWRLMEQLIIAGMVDTPVDSATLYAYYRSSGRRQFDPYTLEKFYRTFEHDPQLLLPFGVGGGGGRVEGGNNGGSSSSGAGSSNKKFIARRCYMTFMELPVSGQPDPSLLSLKAHMHVEVPGMRLGGARSIEIDVPPLVAPSSIPAPPMQPYHYSPPPVSAPSGSGVFGNMRPPLQAAGATAGYPSTLSNSSGGNAVQQPPPSYLPQYGYHYGGGTRGFNDGKNEPPLIYSSDEDEGSHLGSPPGTYGSGGSGGNPPYSYSGVRSQHNPAEGGANPPPYSMR